jgi:hypothetical protein
MVCTAEHVKATMHDVHEILSTVRHRVVHVPERPRSWGWGLAAGSKGDVLVALQSAITVLDVLVGYPPGAAIRAASITTDGLAAVRLTAKKLHACNRPAGSQGILPGARFCGVLSPLGQAGCTFLSSAGR